MRRRLNPQAPVEYLLLIQPLRDGDTGETAPVTPIASKEENMDTTSTIIWTKIDEAPALATLSLLPVVQAFTRKVLGVRIRCGTSRSRAASSPTSPRA